MFTNKKWMVLIALVAAATMILPACAPPTPEVIVKEVPVEKKVVETVVVEKEVPVEKEVVKEVVVTKEVVKEVVVTPTPVPPPERPVTLNMNLGTEPPTADPALATDTTSVFVTEQIFLGLTDYDDETSEVVPELATEWWASEDGLTWTFKMHDKGKWVKYNAVTGEVEVIGPVTAHDVEYAVKRTVDPATASDYAYVLYIIKNAEAINTGEEPDIDKLGVKAIDDYTVEFTLEHPAGYFPAIASMWVCRPVPKDVIERVGERWIEPGFIVTNGPYVLTEWVHDDHMVFVKNPHYWDADKVQIERIEAVMVTEASTAFAMYEANELDYESPPLEEMDRVKADPVLSKELLIAPRLCTYYYGFTNNKPPFDNVLVRRAFSAAIDRKSLVEEVLKGGQQPANTFAPPGIFGNAAFDPDIAPWALPEEKGGWGYEKAVEQARAWLAEAGYPGGEGFPKVTLMHNTSEGHRRIAEAITAMWREALGVEVEITDQEWKVYLKTIKKDTPLEDMPHIWRLGWCADYPDQNNWVHEVFNATAGANRLRRNCADPTCTEIGETEFDKLTRAAGIEQDPAKRAEMYKRAEKILVEEEAAMAPIYYYTRVVCTKPWLHRTYSPLGLGHVHLWTIDWEAKKKARGW